jgi:hypothetical protein
MLFGPTWAQKDVDCAVDLLYQYLPQRPAKPFECKGCEFPAQGTGTIDEIRTVVTSTYLMAADCVGSRCPLGRQNRRPDAPAWPWRMKGGLSHCVQIAPATTAATLQRAGELCRKPDR